MLPSTQKTRQRRNRLFTAGRPADRQASSIQQQQNNVTSRNPSPLRPLRLPFFFLPSTPTYLADGAHGVELDGDELAEPRRVVITHGLGVSEGLEDGVSLVRVGHRREGAGGSDFGHFVQVEETVDANTRGSQREGD